MLQWQRRITAEFWRQGDRERAFGLPVSPLNDRTGGALCIAKTSYGFCEFVVAPLIRALAPLIPEVEDTALLETLDFWREKMSSEATYEDIFGGPSDEPFSEWDDMLSAYEGSARS